MQKYLNHEKKLEFVIANTTKKFFKYKGFHIFRLIANWKLIAKEYSEISKPLNIQKQQIDHVLYLEVENEALIFELEYNKDHLISLINLYFGKEYISKLKFKLANKQQEIKIKKNPKPLKKTVLNKQTKSQIEEISDELLKEKLTNLAHFFH